MKDIIEVIFTHTHGQSLITIDLHSIHALKTGMFENKHQFERYLRFIWETSATLRPVVFKNFVPVNNLPDVPKLVKISTCHYTNVFELPEWLGEWDGKFYYELETS